MKRSKAEKIIEDVMWPTLDDSGVRLDTLAASILDALLEAGMLPPERDVDAKAVFGLSVLRFESFKKYFKNTHTWEIEC